MQCAALLCWEAGSGYGHVVSLVQTGAARGRGAKSSDNDRPTGSTYTRQRGRAARCALREIGVRYWDHAGALFGWAPDEDHAPCPMAFPYQLVRNILAASIGADGRLSFDRGHALVLYDERNPTMASGGVGDYQWIAVMSALRMKEKLRRISWQSLITQWPKDDVLCWLHRALDEKYGLTH